VQILCILFSVGIVALLAPAIWTGWTLRQLHQSPIREQVEQLASRLGAHTQLTPVVSSNGKFLVKSAEVAFADGSRARADDLQSSLDWNSYRRGIWHIVDARVGRIEWNLAATDGLVPKQAQSQQELGSGETGDRSGWLDSWLPKRTTTDTISVQCLDIHGPDNWNLTNARLLLNPWQQGDKALSGTLSSGTLVMPPHVLHNNEPQKLQLQHAEIILTEQICRLVKVDLKHNAANLNVNALLRNKEMTWLAQTKFEHVELADWLPKPWCHRLSGALEGELNLQGTTTGPSRYQGNVTVKDGKLRYLPQLNQIAAWTGLASLCQLEFEVATTTISGNATEVVFDPLELVCHGLLRLKGRLTIRGDELDGQFWLGVTPETLRWLPGASEHVFTETDPDEAPGLRWTRVHLTGTRQAPREDLSQRLVESAGKAALDLPAEVAAQGGALLLEPLLGKPAAQPDMLLKNATDTGGKALESGTRLIESLGGLLGK
jgi:hypothetical protein